MSSGLEVTNPNFEPYGYFSALTKSDTTVLEGIRGIYVGGAGDVAVAGLDGVAQTFKAVAAGTKLDIAITRQMDTNTTATLVLGLK